MFRIHLNRLRALALSVALLPGAILSAQASVVAQFVGGTASANSAIFVGQSLTTAAGGPFDHITFNFFSDTSNGTTPSAAGNLYILAQSYLGTPAGLSSATAGFIAQSTGVSGGIFQFDPGVTLLGGTQYFVYADATFPISGANSDAYAGGKAFTSPTSGSAFVETTADANFRLSGTQVGATVASPGTLALASLALAGMLAAQRRRQPTD